MQLASMYKSQLGTNKYDTDLLGSPIDDEVENI